MRGRGGSGRQGERGEAGVARGSRGGVERKGRRGEGEAEAAQEFRVARLFKGRKKFRSAFDCLFSKYRFFLSR